MPAQITPTRPVSRGRGVALDDDAAGALVVDGTRDFRRDRLEVFPAGAGAQHDGIVGEDRPRDGGDFRRRLALAENHLREPAPAAAVGVHPGEPQVDERGRAISAVRQGSGKWKRSIR